MVPSRQLIVFIFVLILLSISFTALLFTWGPEDSPLDLTFPLEEHHWNRPESVRSSIRGNTPSAGNASAAGVTLTPVMPLRTRGSSIVDAHGLKTKLNCVNWHGANDVGAMHGLQWHPLHWWVKTIGELGFNCVRLSFSLENVLENGTPDKEYLAGSPDLEGLTTLQILDVGIEALTRSDIIVILCVHTLASRSCCSDTDGEGLWYTSNTKDGYRSYSEGQFFEGITRMARRYKSNALVAGFDLKNELRPDRYASPNLHPTWGGGDVATDWLIAARKASLLVLAEDKDLIILVSALNFGQYLCDIPAFPLHLDEALQGHIVYTVHHYVFFVMPWFLYYGMWCFREGIAFWNCVYTTAVLLAFFVSWRRHPGKSASNVGSILTGKGAIISVQRIAQLVTLFPCVTFVVGGMAACNCGMIAEIVKLSCELLSVGFISYAIILWAVIAGRRALAGTQHTCFAKCLNSFLFPALGLQVAVLTICAYNAITFPTWDRYVKAMDAAWGFLGSCSSADPARTAPVWISEIGQRSDPYFSGEVDWWHWFLRYLRTRDFAGLAWWSLIDGNMSIFMISDGLLRRGSGVLEDKWQDAVVKPLQQLMRDWIFVPKC